eukprot:GHRR01012644.1.p1 GENE.GHRR01012644.1~~GHRR01012644.1.p1  ORF type:complete len:510 (+),score=175.53 GHRR01012644.1:535-2064(+)
MLQAGLQQAVVEYTLLLSYADLVVLVTVYDAVIATIGVAVVEGGLSQVLEVPDLYTFSLIVSVTSALALAARLLYQRALSLAPLSLTVPYMAFTPAFVVCLSPLFLVSEIPSPLGFLGVFIVSVSGYLLGLITAPAGSSSMQPSSSSKSKLPVIVQHQRMPACTSWPGSKQQHQLSVHSEQQQQGQEHDESSMAVALWQRCSQQHAGRHTQLHNGFREATKLSCILQDGNVLYGNSNSSNGSGSTGHKSVWAAYYKHKPLDPSAGSVQLIASAAPAGISSTSSISNLVDVHSTASSSISVGTDWIDSQAKGIKAQATPSKAAVQRAARILQDPVRSKQGYVQQVKVQWAAAMSSPSVAPAMVLTCAALYSLTAAMDKLGIAAANGLAAYFLAQRLLIGAASLMYLLFWSPKTLRHLVKDAPLLLSISIVEQASVVFYLNAIENLLVSYVVAIKRINVLLSTLVGCFLFKEQIRKRVPYILVMLCGMLLIVLQPGHEDLHHSHHTRHLLC